MQLKTNDKVAIIAPASQFRSADRELLNDGVQLLESWGLSVDIKVDHGHHFYLAGSDSARQGYLNSALIDPEIKAIFCTRGGYGSARLLQKLPEPGEISRKLVVGHSDITALHLAMLAKCPTVYCIHGPNIATRQLLDDTSEAKSNRDDLKKVLFEPDVQEHSLDILRTGVGQGEIVGGCLSVLCTSIGTPYFPCLDGKVVFIEDVGEAPYKIDRMLQQLVNAGSLEGVQGIIFGAMHKCEDPYNNIGEVILDVLGAFSFPVFMGLESGHGPRNKSIRLSSLAKMDGSKGLVQISTS